MKKGSLEMQRLTQVDRDAVIALMNHPNIRHHMPLLRGEFDRVAYDNFIRAKEEIWEKEGYGPWAFLVNGVFIGWGGLQPEGQDVEMALVLHPDYWGWGKRIYDKVIEYAFAERQLTSIIILLPPSRQRVKGILRLGFIFERACEYEGERYMRYRLYADRYRIRIHK